MIRGRWNFRDDGASAAGGLLDGQESVDRRHQFIVIDRLLEDGVRHCPDRLTRRKLSRELSGDYRPKQ